MYCNFLNTEKNKLDCGEKITLCTKKEIELIKMN